MASLPLYDRVTQNGQAGRQISSEWNDQREDAAPDSAVNFASAVLASATSRGTNKTAPIKYNSFTTKSTTAEIRNTVQQDTVIGVPNLFRAKTIAGRSVNTLQEWEGLVHSSSGTAFTARLRDLTNPGRSEEIAEIAMDGIDPSDVARVKPGAVFHLIVGYTRRNGAQRLETFTYFRRHLPSGQAVANEIVDLLDMLEGDAD
jgi:hypothetical protein